MLDLHLKPAGECRYDAVSLGEVMLRLDPGEGRIRCAREFKVWEGGGEYNAVRGLHKCYGLRTGVMTAFADNEVGKLLRDLIEQGGVDTGLICWKKTDGIGRICRNGLNFTERGFGIRGAVGCSDRFNTAVSQLRPDDLDFEYIFGTLGVRWLHTGGIYAALSDQSRKTLLEACRTAKKHGTVISYDLNYRSSLWTAAGGPEKALQVNREAAEYVDVMIGTKEDYIACLGLKAEKNEEEAESCCRMAEEAVRQFPNLKAAAMTLCTVHTATVNDWKAFCHADGRTYSSRAYDGLEILDRVGIGDTFACGLIYGLMTTGDPELAVNYGAAQGALAVTTPGDSSMADREEVEAAMRSGSPGIRR